MYPAPSPHHNQQPLKSPGRFSTIARTPSLASSLFSSFSTKTGNPAAAAIAFYGAAFGAAQKTLMPALDGMRVMHCELEINGGSVMLSDAFPEMNKTRPPVPGDHASVSVSLEFGSAQEVDDTVARCAKLGATTEMGPMNSFWGTRFAVVRDPFGHRWMLNGPLG